MMKLRIYPDSVLKQECEDVQIGDDSVTKILDEMALHLYEWSGAGLAAPQVGILKKMVVIDIREEPATLYKMINPRILWKSEELVESKEGCLSLPILRETVLRHEKVKVGYFDENFKEREISADGFMSCCLQHEIDHLSGILYIDHLGKSHRRYALRKFSRLQKKATEEAEEKEAENE